MTNASPTSSAGGVRAKRKYESARQLERQSRILNTAREMLAEVGYNGLTIRGLATRAGAAQGTLYNLFGSKDELIVAAIEDQLSELAERAAARSQPGIDRILTLGEETSGQIRRTPEYAEAMARAVFSSSPEDALTKNLYLRGLANLREQLNAAKAAGELGESVHVPRLARHLHAQTWGLVAGWMLGMFPLKQLSREYRRSQVMTLASCASGEAKERLQQELEAGS
ncbi:MAG: TetR/AcrR family transcriptional regulator [Pseudomonadaceae bacterium]|nr:TetR/AcrR family transcriptional regulator [Pseudomonadaceae bacterium]